MGSASVVGRAWSANAFDPGIPYAYKKTQVHQVQGFLEVSISSRLRRSPTNDGVNYFAQRRRLARLAEGKQGSWRCDHERLWRSDEICSKTYFEWCTKLNWSAPRMRLLSKVYQVLLLPENSSTKVFPCYFARWICCAMLFVILVMS